MADVDAVLQMTGVGLSYGSGEGRVDVLRDVSLTIRRGDTVGITGRSGSGKSSLLMVMTGLERARHGQILLAGERLDGQNEDRLARLRGRLAGVVFQSFHLMPTMTALENVAMPLEIAGKRNAFHRARAELEAMGLGARAQHYPPSFPVANSNASRLRVRLRPSRPSFLPMNRRATSTPKPAAMCKTCCFPLPPDAA